MRQPTRSRALIAALAMATAFAVAAAPASAATGGVYFDDFNNTAAGDPNQLFNGTFTGDFNVGLGVPVMPNLTTGHDNAALGANALLSATSGEANTALGDFTLVGTTTGDNNVAVGMRALPVSTGNGNVAVGRDALADATTASRNIAIGSFAGTNLTTGGLNVDIANPGVAGDSGTIRIGTAANQTRAFLAGVWNKTITGPTKAVVVNSKGQLGTGPAPAAPVSGKLSRLRDKVHQQSAELRQQRRTFTHQIQRLREQMQNGG